MIVLAEKENAIQAEKLEATKNKWEKERDAEIAKIFERFIRSFDSKERAQLKALLLMIKGTFEAILEEPYNDALRILDEKSHDRLLRNTFLRSIFEDCGFQLSKGRSMVFSYGNSFTKMLVYKDLLETHLARLKDNLDVNAIDFIDFPYTRSFIGIFSKDLSMKACQDERIALKITFDEALSIQKQLGVSRLEEYICSFGTNREEFQETCRKTVNSRHRLGQFYFLLRNLWVETCALRKVFVFMSQSFNDEISLTSIAEKQSENAKTAQAVLPFFFS